MVYNGEIYNYVEIRRELELLGWTFTSTGDTQVLLKAYLEWERGALPRLDGTGAFAIHDHQTNSLILSRDRFGETPLLDELESGLAFALGGEAASCLPGRAR